MLVVRLVRLELLVQRLGMAAAGSLGSQAGLVGVHLSDKHKGRYQLSIVQWLQCECLQQLL